MIQKFFLAFGFAAILSLSQGQDCGGVGGLFTLVGGRCVSVEPFLISTWDEGRYYCQNLAADLVTIHDIDFYNALLHFIREKGLHQSDYWTGGYTTDTVIYNWVATEEEVAMGSPFWALYGLSDGTYEQEPRSSKGNCVRLDSNRGLHLDDFDCTASLGTICEKLPAN